MNLIWKGKMCEIINLGKSGGCRLYCEGISKIREDHILENIGVDYTVRSQVNEQFDGALILDFGMKDVSIVKFYFGERDGD